MNKNSRLLTGYLKEKLTPMYDNPLVSKTKTKLFLKKFCGLSFKNRLVINSNVLKEDNFK